MPRPLTGSVRRLTRPSGRGAWEVRVRGRGVVLGYEPHWNEGSAHQELHDVILPTAKLNLPWWEKYQGTPPVAPSVERTFHELATDYLESLSRYANPKTREASESPIIKHLLPFFAYKDAERKLRRTAREIDGPPVSAYVEHKQRERGELAELRDRLTGLDDRALRDDAALRALIAPRQFELLLRYGQRSAPKLDAAGAVQRAGKRSLSSRGNSDNEINRSLDKLVEILRLAAARRAWRSASRSIRSFPRRS